MVEIEKEVERRVALRRIGVVVVSQLSRIGRVGARHGDALGQFGTQQPRHRGDRQSKLTFVAGKRLRILASRLKGLRWGATAVGVLPALRGRKYPLRDSEKCDDRGPVGCLIWSAQKCVSRKRHGKRRSVLAPRNSLKPRRLPYETPPALRRRCICRWEVAERVRRDVTGDFASRQ